MFGKKLYSILLSISVSTTVFLGTININTIYCNAEEINTSAASKMKYGELKYKIDADILYDTLKTLSSTSRVAGLPEEKKTVEFISNQFKDYGYDVNVQPFDFTADYTKTYANKNQLMVQNMNNKQWATKAIKNSNNGKIKGELFYYGDEKINIKNLKNKIVIILQDSTDFYKKINDSINEGALGIIFCMSSDTSYPCGLGECDKILALGISQNNGQELISKLTKNKKLTASITIEGAEWSKKSNNVIAIKKPTVKNKKPDILIISAHHDTVKGTTGANDNASGTSVVLETARVLSKIPTDTEIRFVSFGAEELGLLGSKYYAKSLSEDEKKRIIGDIEIDMVGNKKSNTLVLGTIDGKDTLLTKIINKTSKALNNKFNIIKESRSDHASFVRSKIPAVLLTQDYEGTEYHSTWDKYDIISKEKLKSAADVVAETAGKIMDKSTPSLIKEAHEINDYYNYIYNQPTKSVIYFGMNRDFIENKIGLGGKLIFSGKNEFNDSLEKYLYNMKWFEYDKVIPTEYDYRNNYLESIRINMQEVGISKKDALRIIKKALGEPEFEGMNGNVKQYGWSTIYRKYFSLYDYGNTYGVAVSNYYAGDEVEGEYVPKNGEINVDKKNIMHKKLWGFIKKIITPKDLPRIKKLIIFSDGVSYKLGYSSAMDNTKNNHDFQYAVDINDVFDEEGNYRNFNKMIKTLIHEYGHVLTLNDSQVDLNKTGDIKIFFDKGKYYDSSYMKLFYNKFWRNIDKEHKISDAHLFYKKHRNWFVSEYASSEVSEDIAETFMEFVLRDKPSNETIANKKINFFYGFKEMVDTRNYIRQNLELDKK